MKTFLFQGDSITDAGRSYSDDINLGFGYAGLITAEMNFKYPQKYKFINRGISGNRISDVIERMENDIISLNPDVMSILIGINDVWRESENGKCVIEQEFKKEYCELIEKVKSYLPDTDIIILEPFALKESGNSGVWDNFKKGREIVSKVSQEIAEKYSLKFIPLQKKFVEAEKTAPTNYWLSDGVHPTPAGHFIIAEELKKVIEIY